VNSVTSFLMQAGAESTAFSHTDANLIQDQRETFR